MNFIKEINTLLIKSMESNMDKKSESELIKTIIFYMNKDKSSFEI